MLPPIRSIFSALPAAKQHFRGLTRGTCLYPGSIIIAVLFSSCAGNSTEKGTAKDYLPAIILPKASPVSTAEFNRIKNACAAWYDSTLKQKSFNGGIIVAKNGNIIFEQYSGTGHLPGTDSINENTSLHIASTSKTFTAMAVLKLWQDGKLSLDDEYSKYFPAFNYPGITIRTLLNHRSGLPNYIYFMENLGWDKARMVTNEDVMDYLITHKAELENVAPPDIHFSYSNTNFALLALLVEKIAGIKFPEYLQRVFFKPLQMKNTFMFSHEDSNKVKPSYDWKGRLMSFGFLDEVYGDKNIYSTPRDLLTWDRALTSGLIFTPATLEQAYAPYSNEKPGIKNYGLGWRMNIFPDGKKIIYHNGWWHGSNSTFIRLLQDSATIIVIGNKFTKAIYHAKILANIFGEYYSTEVEDETDALRSTDSIDVVKTDTLLSGKTKLPVKKIAAKEKRPTASGDLQKNKQH